MKVCTIVVPLRDNGGNFLSQEQFNLESNLLDIFGGFTTSTCRGTWKDNDGTVYHDDSLRYEVTTFLADAWIALVKLTAKTHRQLAIYYTIGGDGYIYKAE